METIHYESIKYIIIVLLFVVVGYILYLFYKDLMNIRQEIIGLKTKSAEQDIITDQFKQLLTQVDDGEDGNGDGDGDGDGYGDDGYEDEDTNPKNLFDKTKYLNLENFINGNDSLIMKDISEIDESNSENENENENENESEGEGSPDSQLSNSSTDEDNKEVFTMVLKKNSKELENNINEDVSKCQQILKGGKNKGSTCNKNVVLPNTEYCKIHSN